MQKLLVPTMFVLAMVLIVHTIIKQGTFFTDELIIQETANTMFLSGDFVSPRIEGMVDFAKPPLVIWGTSILMGIFGSSVFVVRLVTVLVSIVSAVVLLHIIDRFKVMGNQGPNVLPLIVIVSPIFWLFTKNGNFDTTLSMFAGLALLTYHLSINNSKWWLICCLVLGMSLLTRSFLALPFVILILAAKIMSNHFSSRAIKIWIAGIALMLLSILPWHLAALLTDPGLFIEGYVMFPFKAHLFDQSSSFAQLSLTEYIASVMFLFPLAPFVVYSCWKLRTKIVHFRILAVWLGGYVVVFSLLAKNLWYLPILAFPYSILAIYGISALLHKSGVLPILTKVYVLLIVGVFVLLNMFPVPANSVIEAIKQYEAVQGTNGVLYVLDRNYFPKTSLFPTIEVKYLERSELKAFDWSGKAVLIKRSDTHLLNGMPVYVLVQMGDYSIVTGTI